MPDLSSVAREAAERAYPTRLPYNAEFERRVQLREGFERGFTECASRIPSEEEIAHAMAEADGQVLSGLTDQMLDFMYGAQARAVRALIGEKISG